METAISLPFSIDAYGAVTAATTQDKIWSDRVRSVLGTNFNERIMRPTFGGLVPSVFMETVDHATTMLEVEVRTTFATQLPSLTLQSVDIVYDEYSDSMNVSVLYSLPDEKIASTTIALITVDGTNPANQENL
jgi:hypothetical protein